MDSWSPLLQVLQAIAVAGLTLFGVLYTQRKTTEHQTETKRTEIEAQREQVRNDLQLKTLMAIQSVAYKYVDEFTNYQFLKSRKLASTESLLRTETMMLRIYKLANRLAVLRERIKDDDVRIVLKQLSETIGSYEKQEIDP